MTAAETAENIKRKVTELARDAADRYDRIHARPEDWLDFDFRRREVERVVREVLIDYLIGRKEDA